MAAPVVARRPCVRRIDVRRVETEHLCVVAYRLVHPIEALVRGAPLVQRDNVARIQRYQPRVVLNRTLVAAQLHRRRGPDEQRLGVLRVELQRAVALPHQRVEIHALAKVVRSVRVNLRLLLRRKEVFPLVQRALQRRYELGSGSLGSHYQSGSFEKVRRINSSHFLFTSG